MENLGIFLGVISIILYYANRSKTEIIEIKREAIDWIRGVSIIAICLIHVESYYRFFQTNPNDLGLTVLRTLSNLSRFSVPTFVIVSTMLVSKSNFREYWSSKWGRLFFPYTIIATIAFSIKYLPILDLNHYSLIIKTYLTSLISGSAMAPYYFVPLMFQVYCFFYLFHSRFQNTLSNLLMILGSILVNYYLNIFENSPSWFIGNFIFFVFFGMLVRNQIRFHTSILYTFSIYIVFLIFESSVRKEFHENHLLFYPIGFLGSTLIFLKNHSLNSKVSLMIRKAGKFSLYIFLIHPILLHCFHWLNPVEYPILIPLSWILCVFIPIKMGEFIEKIKKNSSKQR
jgi:surface polysaccharide O-acyltransferase-like enzyme